MNPALPPEFLRLPLAHRAFHDITDGRPENSRAAIRAAIAAGYGIEIDVQSSADKEAMVFHDYDLERLADGPGKVRDHRASELAKIPLRGGDETIPTLSDVLDLVAGRVPLLIEIKDLDGEMGTSVGPLENSIAAVLADYDGPVALMSFNPHSVMKSAEVLPGIPRGLVTGAYDVEQWGLPAKVCDRLRDIPDYDRAGCSFISHQHQDLNRPRVSELKSAGAKILCWTVKSPKEEATARKTADNITFEQYLAPFPG